MTHEETHLALNKIGKILKSGSAIALGEIKGEKGLAPLVFDTIKSELFWSDPFCDFQHRKISVESLKDIFQAVHLISPFKYSECTTNLFRKGKTKQKNY